MEREIITTIICATGVFVAAIIIANIALNGKDKSNTVTQRKMFILGANLAKIGCTKLAPNSARKGILFSTMSLLRELNFPRELERELEVFAEEKESISELQESLQRIKRLIGMQVAARLGRNNVGYYNIGFNMINVTPILEQASKNIEEAGKVAAESIHGIEGDARTVGLPTRNLKAICKLVDKGLSSHKGEVFGQARSDLIQVGQNYIDILEGK